MLVYLIEVVKKHVAPRMFLGSSYTIGSKMRVPFWNSMSYHFKAEGFQTGCAFSEHQ